MSALAQVAVSTASVSGQAAGTIGAAIAAAVLNVQPAKAGLFDGGQKAQDEYVALTMSLIDKATEIIALPLDDDTLEARAGDLRKDINNWVARYRRDDRFSGKPSFSNLYSAVNAIAGHYNSFGPTARIPAKRLDRIKVELEQAKRFVNNGR